MVIPLLLDLWVAAGALASPPRPPLPPLRPAIPGRCLVSSGEECGRNRTSRPCSPRTRPLALTGALAHAVAAVSPSFMLDLTGRKRGEGLHSGNAEAGWCGLVAPGQVPAAAGALCGAPRRRAARQSTRCASAAISGLLKALVGLCAASQTLRMPAARHHTPPCRHARGGPQHASDTAVCEAFHNQNQRCDCVARDNVHGVTVASQLRTCPSSHRTAP